MKSFFFICILTLSLPGVFAQSSPAIMANELSFLNGLYEGTLTYKDYTSGELEMLRLVANTYVKKEALTIDIFINENGKPYNQNYTYDFENGTINKGELIDKHISGTDQAFNVAYTYKGKDGNERKSCTFRITMKGDMNDFSITKEVLFDGTKEYFVRNQYRFDRVKNIQEKASFQ